MGHSRFNPCARTAIVVSCLIALFAFGQAITLGARANGPGLDDPTLYDAVLPDQQSEVLDETAGQLSSYHIVAEISPSEPDVIDGSVDLRFVNTTGSAQDAVYLRLYANDPIYSPFGVELGPVEAGGVRVAVQLSVN